MPEQGVGGNAIAFREDDNVTAHNLPSRNALARTVTDNERARTGEVTQRFQHAFGACFLDDRDHNRRQGEDQQDQGFLKVAEREIDDAAAEQQRQHWLAHDFNNDAKRRAPVAARELVEPFGLEAGLRLAFAQARHGGQG